MNQQPTFMTSPRNLAFNKYNSSRYNLLLVLIFTLINVVICATGSDTYFLFSATIPYVVTVFGVAFSIELAMPAFTYIGCAIAILLLVPYLLCWLFSKKKYGWLIGALVYFVLDTLFLFIFFLDVSMIIDYVFHAWVIFSLATGIANGKKLKTLPEEPVPEAYTVDEDGALLPEDSEPLRAALSEEKIKVDLEADVDGRHVIYRKYGKGLEELVVDNYVYADFSFKGIAKPHFMSAVVGGKQITVGYHQMNYIVVNNVVIKQSTRWI